MEQARSNGDDRLDRFAKQVDMRFDHFEARVEKRFDALQQAMIITMASMLVAVSALFAALRF